VNRGKGKSRKWKEGTTRKGGIVVLRKCSRREDIMHSL